MSDSSISRPVMAFDFGERQIGVAVGQHLTATASPLKILKARDGIPDWKVVMALIEEWQPGVLVVGLPYNMDGSESAIAARARKFANRLHGRTGLRVELHDERLSSFEARQIGAEDNLQFHGRASRDTTVDAVAAALILESWFRECDAN